MQWGSRHGDNKTGNLGLGTRVMQKIRNDNSQKLGGGGAF